MANKGTGMKTKMTMSMVIFAVTAMALTLGGCDSRQAGTGDAVAETGVDGASGGVLARIRGLAGPAAADTSRLVSAEVVDEQGFGQPTVALRLQVPAGWQTAGGVRWNDAADCHSQQLKVAWAAVSPDNASVLELLPGYVWQVQGTELPVDPCPVASYRSAREFLEAIATQARPNARVLDYSDWPEQAARAEQQALRYGEPLPEGIERRFEAGRMLIGYQSDGVEMREVMAAAVGFSRVASNGNVVASAFRVSAYRAPEGELELALFDRVVDSMEEDPQWFQMAIERVKKNVERFYALQLEQIKRWHARRMAEINARGAADRAAIWAQATREISAMRAQTHANTMATNDRIHARGIDGIYERNAYAGIHGGTVYSSIHGGSRVFQDNDTAADAWSTDDPYVQPTNATELERIR